MSNVVLFGGVEAIQKHLKAISSFDQITPIYSLMFHSYTLELLTTMLKQITTLKQNLPSLCVLMSPTVMTFT